MIDSRYAWWRLAAAVALSTIGGVGLWSIVVALPTVQAEFGTARSDASLPYTLTGLSHMARLVQENLKLIIDAIGEEDAEKALLVWRSDEAIDQIYNALFRELITYMMEDPRNITPCTHLLFIAKNMERCGDHATNIAEVVYHMVRAGHLANNRPKADTTSETSVPFEAQH